MTESKFKESPSSSLRNRNENDASKKEIISSIMKAKNTEEKKKKKSAKKRSSLIPSTGNSLTDITLFLSCSIFLFYLVLPSQMNPFEPFILLSHKDGINENGESTYVKGWNDCLFVAYYILVFTWLRDLVMRGFLRKIGIYVGGIIYENKVKRFEEQGYAFLYYLTSSCFGLICMSQLPTWFFKTTEFWNGYPHVVLSSTFKSYYLLQLSFWLQQAIVLVLGLEAARKDFVELIAHHIVTILLIVGSYLTNYTRIGNAVFLTMDISDVFLALSKLLNYGPNTKKIGEPVFAFFIFVWAYTRHYLFVFKILYSVYYEYLEIVPLQEIDVGKSHFGGPVVWYSFLILLVLLEMLCIFWFFLILRILFNLVISGGKKASDEREDDEEQGELVEEIKNK